VWRSERACNPRNKEIEEDRMRQVRITVRDKVVSRIAVVACVAILGVGVTACGSSDGGSVTPGAPATNAPSAATTPPKSGGAGF